MPLRDFAFCFRDRVLDHQIWEFTIGTLNQADSAGGALSRFGIFGQQPIEKLRNPFDRVCVSVYADERVLWFQDLYQVPSMPSTTQRSIDYGAASQEWSRQTRPVDNLLK